MRDCRAICPLTYIRDGISEMTDETDAEESRLDALVMYEFMKYAFVGEES